LVSCKDEFHFTKKQKTLKKNALKKWKSGQRAGDKTEHNEEIKLRVVFVFFFPLGFNFV